MKRTGGSTQRILLLAIQGFALGVIIALIAISANAIFLEAYGSGPLPVTYIGAAAAGAAATTLLTRALRRRALTAVAIRLLTVLAVAILACWLLLWKLGAIWVSFALLVLLPILVPVGFVFLVGQAGALLDVRLIKSLYPRVIAGFALGFVTGGLAGAPLLAVFGSADHLLAAAAGVVVLLLVVVVVTRRMFPRELSTVDSDDHADRPTLRSLLSNRFVVLLVLYQMLSAVESQWLDFLVYDRASQRYADAEQLATFLGRFLAITYTADILFLMFVAGVLLRRFGLKYGLSANPVVVFALVSATLAAAAFQGSGATVVFVLIVATRVSDLVLGDASTRTSVGAAYQAVPARQRLAAQATVEGLAVPMAIGVSGLVLIAVRATVGTDGPALPLLTSAVLVAWIVVAWFVYRDYRVNLLDNLRHRELDPVELEIDGEAAIAVVERLLDSGDDRDVRLALDTLQIARSPDLSKRLEQLALTGRASVRVDALERLSSLEPVRAAAAARQGLDDWDPAVRAASVRTLGLLGGADDVRAISGHVSDSDDDVQLAAAIAMSRIGDAPARAEADVRIASLAGSAMPAERILAARILGACDPTSSIDRRPLSLLIGDADHHVVNAALNAVRCPIDAHLLVSVVHRLEDRHTAGAAIDALSQGGSHALSLIDDGLSGRIAVGRRAHERLTRVCRVIGGPDAAAVLLRHLAHRDRDLGLSVMRALVALAPSRATVPTTVDVATHASVHQAATDIVEVDLRHTTLVLRALQSLDAVLAAESLRAALRDELDLQRHRVLAGLALRHGEGMHRVAFQLAQNDTRLHALAMEWLDVTLAGTDRGALALLDPGLTTDARLRVLSRLHPMASATPEDIVRDIAEDLEDTWRRPWISACAVLAASGMPELSLDSLVIEVDGHIGGTRDDGAIVRETLDAIRPMQPHVPSQIARRERALRQSAQLPEP